MNRRTFLAFLVAIPLAKRKRFRYRLRTKDHSIIGGTINATDRTNAEYKLKERYRDCTIIELKEL